MNDGHTLFLALALLATLSTHASSQDALLATNLTDSGTTGTGQLANSATNIAFSWREQQDSGTTTFNLNTAPSVYGAEAWYVDTDSGDKLTVTLVFEEPVMQPLFFVDRMDDADLDFGITPGVEAFIVEQTGEWWNPAPNLFTAPSGLDAASGTIGLSGNYSRVTFSISSASGRDVIHLAAGADSVIQQLPRFSSLGVVSGSASLALTDLLIGSTTTVQKAEDLLSPVWTNIAQFITSGSSTNIDDTVQSSQAFYQFIQQ